MNQEGQHMIQQLAVKLSLHDKSPEALETVIEHYPYFGFAHLLLAARLKKGENECAQQQLQKTALHFTNPFWLQYLITENETAVAEALADEPFTKEEQHLTPFVDSVVIDEEPIDPGIITPVQEAKPEILQENDEPDEDLLPVDEDEDNAAMNVNLSKLIEQHLSEFKKPIEPSADTISKPSPFHTIDYFASQGIKFIAGQQTDMLGNKVKSFTEWLKQMKRINQQPTDLGTDAETEHIIEAIAKTSNETKDVITETMAEVLAKQGKTDKAIQLYQKLSFLDTAKSTYLAAKIQELKSKIK